MKKDNSILTKLLDHLIGEAEGGECDEIDKYGDEDKGDESDGNDTDIVNEDDLGEHDNGDEDENAKKLKKFMSSIKD